MNITIPTPCHENWQTMQAKDQGRFCNACSTIVVNFTEMQPQQITDYFLQNSGKKVCGRFTAQQLHQQNSVPTLVTAIPAIFNTTWPAIRKWAAVIFLFFSISIQANAQTASTKNVDEPVFLGEPAVCVDPSVPAKRVGKVLPAIKPALAVKKANKKKPVTKKPKETATEKAILMGMIIKK